MALTLELTKEGLGYRAVLVEQGIGLHIDRLLERSGDTSGELTVAKAGPGHVMRARFNLGSMSVRKSTANFLQERAALKGAPSWLDILESFCVAVLDAEREGAPIEDIGGDRAVRVEPEYVLRPLILDGNMQTILYGDGGTGKSTLTAAAAVSVASGEPMLEGWSVPEAKKVLVLDWETDVENWNDMIGYIAKGAGIPVPHIAYRACEHPLPSMVHELAALVSKSEAGLVIVDSTGQAMPGQREGTSAEESAVRLFKAVRLFGVPTLLIDHVAKGENSKGPYGSRYKWNSARAAWELVGGGGEGHHVALFHRKHNLTEKFPSVGIQIVHGEGELLMVKEKPQGDPTIRKAMTIAQQIKGVLEDAGGQAMTVKQIADAVGTGPRTVGVYLNRDKATFVKVRQEGREAFWALVSNTHNTVVQQVMSPLGVDSDEGSTTTMSNSVVDGSVEGREGGRGVSGKTLAHHLQHDDPPGRVVDDPRSNGIPRGAGEMSDDGAFDALVRENESRYGS